MAGGFDDTRGFDVMIWRGKARFSPMSLACPSLLTYGVCLYLCRHVALDVSAKGQGSICVAPRFWKKKAPVAAGTILPTLNRFEVHQAAQA